MPNDFTSGMSPERWQRVEAVLDRALDSDPSRWPMIVAEACGADTDLRRHVEELLAGASRAAKILERDPGILAAELLDCSRKRETAEDPLIGTQLGAWRVVRQVGRGGMSRVFLAQRDDGTYQQTVAIKVLRAGLDTPADHERFRREQQMLAELDHPNIARLLDAGVAPDGRPYLVLEYVDGEPLLAYCDAHQLSIAGRLRLFLSVADGLEAAHRQLIVHRDLKPSNVMVGKDGRARLLDFGVAKMLAKPADAATTRTLWMTPEYAAPEQFTGGVLTTATDVYQLGALLYELLAGHRAFGNDGPEGRSFEERVLHDDPLPPSAHRLALSGDIDAIVLKALRKVPQSRYGSVADFAADVRCHLAREPVKARAGSRAYRCRRWATRHAAALGVGVAAALALAGYLATLTAHNRRIERALATATVERNKSDEVTSFLLRLFQANDPRVPATDTISARTLLERGEQHANALSAQPEVQAAMLQVIGRIQGDVHAVDAARTNLERSLTIRRRVLGDSHQDVGTTTADLARLDATQGDLPNAEKGMRRALAILRPQLGDTSAVTHRMLYDLGLVLHLGGKYAEARGVIDEWERLIMQRPVERNLDFARQAFSLAEQAAVIDSLSRAERLFRTALGVFRERLGERHADVADVSSLLADVIWSQGRAAEAEPLFRQALALMRDIFPKGDVQLTDAMLLFAHHLSRDGRHDEAIGLGEEALGILRRIEGIDEVSLATGFEQVAQLKREKGDLSAAERMLLDTEVQFTRLFGAKNAMVARVRFDRGDVLWRMGRPRDAEDLLLSTYQGWVTARGVKHPMSVYGVRNLVNFYEGTGRREAADPYRALLVRAPSRAPSH